MPDQLEVKESKAASYALGCFGLIFGVLGFGVTAVQFKDHGFSMTSLVILLVIVAVLVAMPAANRHFRRKLPRLFTDDGVVLHGGETLPWSQLTRVEHQVRLMLRNNAKQLWRSELHFSSGRVIWLVPNRIDNMDEVQAYLARLPAPHTEKVVGSI